MKFITLFITLIFTGLVQAQEITLNHNIGSTIVRQNTNHTCSGGGVAWARVFNLDEFGVTGQFTIDAGSFGVERSGTAPGTGVRMHIYEIDESFPESFDENDVLGSSDQFDIPSVVDNVIFDVVFTDPVVIPSSINRILVEIRLDIQNQLVFLGGTEQSNDLSWWNPLNHQSCVGDANTYQTTEDLDRGHVNYYITVTGENLLGVNEKTQNDLILAPIPAGESIRIQMKNPEPILSIHLIDIYGRTQQLYLENHMVDIRSLSAGVYFMDIETSSGHQVKQFVKN